MSEDTAFFSVADFLKNIKEELEPNTLPIPLQIPGDSPSFISQYREWIEKKQNRPLRQNALYCLSDTESNKNSQEEILNSLNHFLQPSLKEQGKSFFLRWQGKGIAINPGSEFLKRLHRLSYNIEDIDYVIVTHPTSDSYSDLISIDKLNYEKNRADGQRHRIEYYLHPHAHRQVTHWLRPHYKQERNTIHSLELYEDSPQEEQLELNEEIKLHYFTTSVSKEEKAPFGISLGLHSDHANFSLSFIFAAYEQFLPKAAEHNLLVIGENCPASAMESFNEQAPAFIFCFCTSSQEETLKTIKTLRQRPFAKNTQSILPISNRLEMTLPTVSIPCSLCQSKPLADQVRLVKNPQVEGALFYLCSDCAI